MGYFLPISAYGYSFTFFYFLTTSTFSYPIWHRCSCYTLTVTKLKPVIKFSNLGCSGGHFGYVSLFLFLGKIQLFNIFSLGCLPYQKKFLQYVLLRWQPFWGVLDKLWGTLFCFLKTAQFYLMKFCSCIKTKKKYGLLAFEGNFAANFGIFLYILKTVQQF